MKASLDSVRAACTRCAAFTGKWLLTIFVAVAAFALAAQALALVLAALALLVIALCLASMCMPEESRAVWAWMRDTLGRWSAVAGTDKTDERNRLMNLCRTNRRKMNRCRRQILPRMTRRKATPGGNNQQSNQSLFRGICKSAVSHGHWSGGNMARR